MDSAVFWGNCCNNCYNCYNHCNCDCNCNCKCNCHMCDDSEGKVPSSKKPSISNLKVFIGMNNDLLPINRVIKEGEYSPVKLTFDITNLKYVQPNSLTLLKPNGDYMYDLPAESPLMLNNDVFDYKYDFPYKWKLWIKDLDGDRYSTEFLFQKGQTNVLFTLKARPDTSNIFFDGVQQITNKEDGWVIATREYPVDTEVEWSVQKRDYITQTGTVVLDEDREVVVDLVEDKLGLILDIRPKNAKVWINDELYTYDTHVTDKDYFWYQMDMTRDTNIVWKVEAHDYIPQRGEFVLSQNTVLNVYLDPIIKKYYLTFNVNPTDAIVKVNGDVYTHTKNFTEGTNISYEVTADGYNSQSGSFILTENTTKNITLDRIQIENSCTLTVHSKPEDATITIDGIETNQVYKPINTIVYISVTKEGYYDRNIRYTIVKDETIELELFREDNGPVKFYDSSILKLQYNWKDSGGRDLDTSTTVDKYTSEWVGFGDSLYIKNLLYFGGDNLSSGCETIMLNNRAFNDPDVQENIIQYNIFANYYGVLRSGIATIRLTSYDTGIIYNNFTIYDKNNYTYIKEEQDGTYKLISIGMEDLVVQRYIAIHYKNEDVVTYVPLYDDLLIPSEYQNLISVKRSVNTSILDTDGIHVWIKSKPEKYLTIINDSVNIAEYNGYLDKIFNGGNTIFDINYSVTKLDDTIDYGEICYHLRKQGEVQPYQPERYVANKKYDFKVIGAQETLVAETDILVKTNVRSLARKGGTNVGSIYYNRETKKAELIVYDDVIS